MIYLKIKRIRKWLKGIRGFKQELQGKKKLQGAHATPSITSDTKASPHTTSRNGKRHISTPVVSKEVKASRSSTSPVASLFSMEDLPSRGIASRSPLGGGDDGATAPPVMSSNWLSTSPSSDPIMPSAPLSWSFTNLPWTSSSFQGGSFGEWASSCP